MISIRQRPFSWLSTNEYEPEPPQWSDFLLALQLSFVVFLLLISCPKAAVSSRQGMGSEYEEMRVPRLPYYVILFGTRVNSYASFT